MQSNNRSTYTWMQKQEQIDESFTIKKNLHILARQISVTKDNNVTSIIFCIEFEN